MPLRNRLQFQHALSEPVSVHVPWLSHPPTDRPAAVCTRAHADSTGAELVARGNWILPPDAALVLFGRQWNIDRLITVSPEPPGEVSVGNTASPFFFVVFFFKQRGKLGWVNVPQNPPSSTEMQTVPPRKREFSFWCERGLQNNCSGIITFNCPEKGDRLHGCGESTGFLVRGFIPTKCMHSVTTNK